MRANDKYLIADAGGTSTQWILCSDGVPLAEVSTGGINASVTPPDSLTREIWNACELIEQADSIYFYGAGCVSKETDNRIKEQLTLYNPSAHIEIASDMLGAARALFGQGSGIACILGTGSNSCAYSDGTIKENVPPLGYILGDEGGGAALGKRLIKAVLRKEIHHADVLADFMTVAGGDMAYILQRIYRQPAPNSYMASFCPLISKYKEYPEIHHILRTEFETFFHNCIAGYNKQQFCTIGFIGSLAKAFESELKEIATQFGLTLSDIQKSPINGLIKFHHSLI